MYRYAIALLLVSCSSTTTPEVNVVQHPAFPVPYSACNAVNWAVQVDGDEAYVRTTYRENVLVAQCFKDLERYLIEVKNVACYYRKDLEESICQIK